MGGRAVIHVDFDYFYAQCEEIRQPSLRTIPVCVCIYSDRGGGSGAVATANYQARKYGAKSGLPIYRAEKLLEGTDAKFIPVDFGYYSDISEKAMSIMEGYADVFEYVGRDEAYLDVTARTGGDLRSAVHLAQQIKNDIRKSLKMTCSAGVSPNKLLSKIASDHKKPDGLTLVMPDSVDSFLDGLPPRGIPGIGGKTARRLDSMGVSTIREMRDLNIFDLQRTFGRKTGTFIYNSARGTDEDPVSKRPPSVQYSRIVTLKKDATDAAEMDETLVALCERLRRTITERRLLFRLVEVQFVHSDLSGRSRSRTLRNHTASADMLRVVARQLMAEALQGDTMPVRRLGVKVSDLSEALGQQEITSYF